VSGTPAATAVTGLMEQNLKNLFRSLICFYLFGGNLNVHIVYDLVNSVFTERNRKRWTYCSDEKAQRKEISEFGFSSVVAKPPSRLHTDRLVDDPAIECSMGSPLILIFHDKYVGIIFALINK
jgi:hypothetical protein